MYSVGHRRAFCYVSDAVAATVAAMREPAAEGLSVNVGNDREEITIGELAERLLRHAGIEASVSPRVAANDPVKRRCLDLTRARNLLGFEPKVMLDEGLERTLAWYAERRGSERQSLDRTASPALPGARSYRSPDRHTGGSYRDGRRLADDADPRPRFRLQADRCDRDRHRARRALQDRRRSPAPPARQCAGPAVGLDVPGLGANFAARRRTRDPGSRTATAPRSTR